MFAITTLTQAPWLKKGVRGPHKGLRRQGIMTSKPSNNANTSAEAECIVGSDWVSVCAHSVDPVTRTKEYWVESGPFGLTFGGTRRVAVGDSWRATVDTWLLSLGSPGAEIKSVVRLDRWLVPSEQKMASHVVVSLIVQHEAKSMFTTRHDGQWLTADEIIARHTSRKVASVLVVDTILSLEVGENHGAALGEIHTADIFMGLEPIQKQKSSLHIVVQAAGFSRTEQEQVYSEFLRICLPHLIMGPNHFVHFMKPLGWSEEDALHLFRTFDMTNRGGLNFRDLVCGLAVLEPSTQHGGPPAEVRCRYIFRYFDKNSDGRLGFLEFKDMVIAIRRAKGLSLDPVAIQEDSVKAASVFGDKVSETLGQTEFLTAVGQLKFRGTSILLRSPVSVASHLKTLRGEGNGKVLPQKPEVSISTSTPAINSESESSLLHENGTFETQVQAELRTYDVATHCVRVKKSGTILDIHSLWDIEESGLANSSGKKILIGGGAHRIKSLENFNQTSKPNEMLNGLKYFEREVTADNTPDQLKPKPAFDWGIIDRGSLAKCLIAISQQVSKIMAAEARLLHLSSPIYILGDLHGNFPDLLCFEKALWRLGPKLTPASFLFLGDYVDRGSYSVEVISYLFAHKISSPNKVFLLRGNHEIRSVQQNFTFFAECITKFGDKMGQEVWEAVNLAFDTMPLAAVIDNQIFCVHGGIPPTWLNHGMVSGINSIPVPLPNPQEQSELAWDLMWSDPLHTDGLSLEQAAKIPLDLDGFGPNTKRQTSHVFTSQALEAFLQRNHFSHVIRAHEVQQAGFKVQLEGKLLTVFSSSNYCGGTNEAACILADNFKLRTIRIDTS